MIAKTTALNFYGKSNVINIKIWHERNLRGEQFLESLKGTNLKCFSNAMCSNGQGTVGHP